MGKGGRPESPRVAPGIIWPVLQKHLQAGWSAPAEIVPRRNHGTDLKEYALTNLALCQDLIALTSDGSPVKKLLISEAIQKWDLGVERKLSGQKLKRNSIQYYKSEANAVFELWQAGAKLLKKKKSSDSLEDGEKEVEDGEKEADAQIQCWEPGHADAYATEGGPEQREGEESEEEHFVADDLQSVSSGDEKEEDKDEHEQEQIAAATFADLSAASTAPAQQLNHCDADYDEDDLVERLI